MLKLVLSIHQIKIKLFLRPCKILWDFWGHSAPQIWIIAPPQRRTSLHNLHSMFVELCVAIHEIWMWGILGPRNIFNQRSNNQIPEKREITWHWAKFSNSRASFWPSKPKPLNSHSAKVVFVYFMAVLVLHRAVKVSFKVWYYKTDW